MAKGRAVRLPGGDSVAELLRSLLPFAILAPSRHNTQPWLFEIEGPEARVYTDRRRALRVADADGRELVLSCAAALENLRVAARHAGRAASIELLADHAGGLVGRLRLEEPRAPDLADEELFLAIASRRTNRGGFDERPLPQGLVARLAREAAQASEGVSLRAVELSARRPVADLVAEADRLQWDMPGFRAELAAWTRAPRSRAPDGVPSSSRGFSGAASLVESVLARFVGRGEPEGRRDRQQMLHAPALLLLSTSGDAPRDWAAAGIAFERVLLRAAAAGLAASYYSAAVEIAPARARLRAIVGERGQPQVLFRLGRAKEAPPTPRRTPELVLRAFRAEPGATTALARR